MLTRRRRLRAGARVLLRGGAIHVLAGSLGYAMLPLWVRWLEPSGLTSLELAFWRYLLAVPAVWLLIRLRNTPPPAQPLPHRGLLALGIILAGITLTAFIGLQLMPVPTYALLVYTYPAQVAFINFLRGERLSRRSWLALLLTSMGILLTLYGVSGGFASISGAGVLAAILTGLFIALYFLVNNHVMRGHQALHRAGAWAMTGALLVILPVSLVARVSIPTEAGSWGLLGGLALCSTVMPVFMYMAGIKRLGASHAAILSTGEPVFTALLAVLLLGEVLQPLQLPGGALILLSIVLLRAPLRLPARRRQPSRSLGAERA